MIGQTISHYKITAKLGAGGMGEVYLATDTKLDREVALKFLPESLQKDAEARRRLIREARAASKLNHPNILTIHAVEEADGRDFIVMEFVGGESLRDLIKAGEQSLGRAIAVGVQICDGLEKAHQAGIVHRDLKPGNILIDEDGRAKLCDFGLAILRETGGEGDNHGILGTAHYISPEQVNGVDVDHRSDIWSLGVVLYEMLAGKPPFPGDYDQAILYAVTSEDALSLNEGPDRTISECARAAGGTAGNQKGTRIADTSTC
jgi:serine/threonine protein kinase